MNRISKGRTVALPGFYKYDNNFSKIQVFQHLFKTGCSMWMWMHTLLMDLPIGLSAVPLLYSLVGSTTVDLGWI